MSAKEAWKKLVADIENDSCEEILDNIRAYTALAVAEARAPLVAALREILVHPITYLTIAAAALAAKETS
jgi:hypothetical protein